MNRRHVLAAAETNAAGWKRTYCIRTQIFMKELNTGKRIERTTKITLWHKANKIARTTSIMPDAWE
jgi:hypothetical protein